MMSTRLSKFATFEILVLIVGLAMVGPQGWGQDSVNPEGSVEIWKLRRILVPESQLDAVIRGRYMPLDFKRFQNLIDLNQQRANQVNFWPLEQISLHGEIRPDGELIGQGLMRLSSADVQEEWFSLRPPSCYMGNFRWRDIDAASARVGMGEGRRWYVENIEAKLLEFDWSMLPQRIAAKPGRNAAPTDIENQRSSNLVYMFELPESSQTLMSLRCPRGWTVSTDHGWCRVLEFAGEVDDFDMALWNIDFLPGGRRNLLIQRSSGIPEPKKKTSYRSDTDFRVGIGVVESTTRFRWQGNTEEFLPVTLPSGWTVMRVRSSGEELPYQVQEQEGERRVSVSIGGSDDNPDGLELVLERYFDLSRSLRLEMPKMRGIWTQGSFSLDLDPVLRTQELSVFEADWTHRTMERGNTEGGPAPKLSAECYSEDASLELKMEIADGMPRGLAYTEVTAEGKKLNAVVKLWGQTSNESSLKWRFPLSSGWIVDQVALVDTDGLTTLDSIESWDVTEGEASSLVDIQLKQSYSAGTEICLRLEAHLLAFPTPQDRLRPKTLGVVDLGLKEGWQHWLGVQAQTPYRFIWSGLSNRPIKPLPTDDRIRNSAEGMNDRQIQLIERGGNPGVFRIQTEAGEPFDADCLVDCVVSDQTVVQQIRIHCRPVDSRLRRLKLRWPQARTGVWTWRLERSGGLLSRSLNPVEEIDATTQNLITLLQWSEGLDEPFTIVGDLNQRWTGQWSPQVPLIDGATRISGALTVSTDSRGLLELNRSRLDRLPFFAAKVNASNRLLGVFDLTTVLTQRSVGSDQIVVAPVTPSNAGVMIWNAQLDSWPSSTAARHQLTFEVEAHGPTALKFQPPRDAVLRRVVVNQKQVAASEIEQLESGETRWVFDLDAVPIRHALTLEFTTSDHLSQAFETLVPPLPEIDAKWLNIDWQVHLPKGYRVRHSGSLPQNWDLGRWSSWLLQRWTGLDLEPEAHTGRDASSLEVDLTFGNRPLSEERVSWREGINRGTQLKLEKASLAVGIDCIIAFAFAGVLLFVVGGRRSLLWAATGLVAVIILWVPTGWQHWTDGLVPGCVLALLIQALNFSGYPRKVSATTYGTLGRAGQLKVTAGLFLLTSVMASSHFAHPCFGYAQEGMETRSESRWVDVIIPVDEEGQPARDLIYLPKEFKDQLLKTTPSMKSENPWIVEGIQHVVDIESNLFGETNTWKMVSRVKLRTLRDNVRYVLPFQTGQVLVSAEQIQLDQNGVTVLGTPQNGLTIEIETAGLHDLVIPGTVLTAAAGDSSFTWNPPEVPNSDFRFNGLSESGWELSTITPPDSSQDLGADRLRFRGNYNALQFRKRFGDSSPEKELPDVRVAETVSKKGEDLFVTLWFRSLDTQSLPKILLFQVEPGWEVQGSPYPEEVEFRLSRQGEQTSCELTLTSEQGQDLVAIRLKRSEPVGVGRCKLPVIVTDAFAVESRQLVLMGPLDTQWAYARPGSPFADQIRADLKPEWSDAQIATMGLSTTETSAVVLPAEFGDEFLELGPDTPVLSADQQIELALGWEKTTFRGSALVSVMRGNVRSVELDGNQPFELSELKLTLEGESQPADVTPLTPSRYLVTFQDEVNSVFTLQFAGEILDRPAEGPLPAIQIRGIQDIVYRCDLTRDPLMTTLLVPLSTSPEAVEEDFTRNESPAVELDLNMLGSDLKRFGRASFKTDGQQVAELQQKCRLRLKRARHAVLDEMLVTYNRENTKWNLSVWARVSEDEPWGLNVVDMEMPEGFLPSDEGGQGRWLGSEEAEPNRQRRWVSNALISPGEWFVLRGTLPRFPNGDGHPKLVSPQKVNLRFALPKVGQEDTFLWQHNSKEVSSQPDVEDGRLSASDEWIVLQLESATEKIRLAGKPLLVRPTRVHLAEHRVSPHQVGFHVQSRFFVDPAGRTSIPLKIPSSFDLLAVEVDGQLQDTAREGQNIIRLTNRELPEEVTVWCFVSASEGDSLNWDQQPLPQLSGSAEVSLLAIRNIEGRSGQFSVNGGRAIAAEAWKQQLSNSIQKVLQVSSTNTQLSEKKLATWIESWESQSPFFNEDGDSKSSEMRTRVKLGDQGDLVWRKIENLDRIKQGPNRLPSISVGGNWQFYEAEASEQELSISVDQSDTRSSWRLFWVSLGATLTLGMVQLGASRLSRQSRVGLTLLLLMTIVAMASVYLGPLWLGILLVGVLAFGLVRIIIGPENYPV